MTISTTTTTTNAIKPRQGIAMEAVEEEPTSNPLEEKARKRQEKLRALKRKREAERNGDKDGGGKTADEEAALPTPVFRSYRPADKRLQEENALDKPQPSDVTAEVKGLLELAKSEVVIDQLDISTLAPRQPDWDLKRDIAKKLEKLERRTQRAMAELIRDRLKEKQDLAELAAGGDAAGIQS